MKTKINIGLGYEPSNYKLTIATSIEHLGEKCHQISKDHGFWELDQEGNAIVDSRNFGEMIALIHSELSEALEHHRKDTMDDHLPLFPGWWVEMADSVIRIVEMCYANKVPLGEIIMDKMDYNERRLYKHGKKY